MATVKKAQGGGTYVTTKSGRVGRTRGEYGPYESMDTTGYSKGKKEFEVKTSYGRIGSSSKTIKREAVPEKIKEFKKGATRQMKILKSGGAVAKDGKWMQKVSKSIKARGTEGKCTPITKPGCTGKAKALAKTFKKIAAKRKAK
jgi:hypothetical protein